MRPMRALACLLLALLTPPRAAAQADLTGSVALQSEYSYRGQTPTSDGARLTPQLTLNLDGAGGWYLGGFASRVTIGALDGYKVQAYAGYAQRLRSGWSWEAGCSHIGYTQLHVNDFQECYGGLSGERFSTRLYYAPRYLGYPARTLYGEVSLFYPLHPRVNLIAHAGLLHNLSNGSWPGIPANSRYDARLGVGIALDANWTLQLAREHGQDDGQRYPYYPVHPSKRWSAGVTYAF
jgi:uncharacterized protein (TIGR02001 family)